MLTEKLLRLTIAGGSEWVMLLLIVLSFLSIAVIAERVVFFRRRLTELDGLDRALAPLLGVRGKLDKVTQFVERSKDPTLVVAVREDLEADAAGGPYRSEAGVSARSAAAGEAREKMVASVLGRERLRLESRLGFLGTLGSNAPFIGLFGTVLGIIRAFNDLAVDAKGGSSAVMAGISEALVATAIGLFVAIPAVMAYNYFQRKVDHVLATTESLAQSILAGRLLREAAALGTAASSGSPAQPLAADERFDNGASGEEGA